MSSITAAKCEGGVSINLDNGVIPFGFKCDGCTLKCFHCPNIILEWGHNLPQLTDIFFSPCLFPVSCQCLSASLSVLLRSSLSGLGVFDKVSVCVYLHAPSSVHYHENGLSPLLILSVSVVINVFIHTLRSREGIGIHGNGKHIAFPRIMQSNMSPCIDLKQEHPSWANQHRLEKHSDLCVTSDEKWWHGSPSLDFFFLWDHIH